MPFANCPRLLYVTLWQSMSTSIAFSVTPIAIVCHRSSVRYSSTSKSIKPSLCSSFRGFAFIERTGVLLSEYTVKICPFVSFFIFTVIKIEKLSRLKPLENALLVSIISLAVLSNSYAASWQNLFTFVTPFVWLFNSNISTRSAEPV